MNSQAVSSHSIERYVLPSTYQYNIKYFLTNQVIFLKIISLVMLKKKTLKH